MLLRPGLVSVTYRQLAPHEVVALCSAAQLEGIEWGGDVHVPHGDVARARAVRQLTQEAGLEVACYGSYYRCDHDGDVAFEAVLDSAVELGAPTIRIWAGRVDAKDAQADDYKRVAADINRISDLAREANVTLSLEFHGETLTARGESADELLAMVPQENVFSLWQPLRRGRNYAPHIEENLNELRTVSQRLSNVHVFEWADDEEGRRQMLSLASSQQWPVYIEELKKLGGERWLLLEFVPDNDPTILTREAQALRAWLDTNSQT